MENENNKHFPYGRKRAENFAAPGQVHDLNNVGCPNMPDGILGAPLNADPHGRGFKMPIGDAPSAARPANDMGSGLLPANGAINPDPHPYNPSSSVKLPNTYARPIWERKLANE